MNYKKPFNIDENLYNEIVSVAYGDANYLIKRKILKLSKQYQNVKELLDEYSTTANLVHSIPQNECPDELVKSVLNKTKTVSTKPSFFEQLSWVYLKRPAISGFAVFLLFGAIFTSVFIKNSDEELSHKELLLAEQQVKQSLAIVGRVLKKSEFIIEDQVFNTNVGQPLKKGVEKLSDLLN